LRDRKRARTRRMVQAEALRLFADKGYYGTTVEDIADAAAISPRTFFRYFATKEDVVVWDGQDLPSAGSPAERPAGESAAESVHAVFREMMKKLGSQDRDLTVARLRLVFTVPEVRSRYWSDQPDAPSVFRSMLAGRNIPVDEPQARVVVMAIMNAAAVAMDRWQRDGGTGDLVALFDEAVNALAAAMRQLRPAAGSAPAM
jgi:AcrR family transcriptional regulator